jgi:hypothetical protein
MPGGSFYDRTVLWRVCKGVCGCQRGGLFAVARQLGAGSLFSIVWQLGASSSSPGGSVKCLQMPRGVFLIIWQLGASSCSSGGLVKVFADARGGVGGTISN